MKNSNHFDVVRWFAILLALSDAATSFFLHGLKKDIAPNLMGVAFLLVAMAVYKKSRGAPALMFLVNLVGLGLWIPQMPQDEVYRQWATATHFVLNFVVAYRLGKNGRKKEPSVPAAWS